MHANAVDFGIGLQLTNVLKDAHRDAQEGRRYVPSRFVRFDGSDSTGSLAPLTSMAKHRLDRGIEYTAAIPYDHAGIRNFCLVALVLASASLQELERRESELLAGADVKITRTRVVELVGLAACAVADNESMRKLWRDLGSQSED
jgi:farnesyl-diphosphate farnesyltransferase